MKNIIFILLISILTLTRSSANQNSNNTIVSNHKHNKKYEDSSLLDYYSQYSSFTNPGEYGYLYENLPESLPKLCSLIKSQFIHIYDELPAYRTLIPKERWNEYLKYPTVQSVLEGLISYDSTGLNNNRQPKDRLVLICRHNAILLVSILKSRGIPSRVRYGHATYLIPGFHTSHVICEVWNETDKRWMFVDPSTNMIDFSREKFDISNDLWLKMQKGEIDPNLYGIPRRYTGIYSIVSKVCSDLASILGREYPIIQYAPILDYAFENDGKLTSDHIKMLNRISELMKSIDTENLLKLKEIYNNTPEIQITKTFQSDSKESKK